MWYGQFSRNIPKKFTSHFKFSIFTKVHWKIKGNGYFYHIFSVSQPTCRSTPSAWVRLCPQDQVDGDSPSPILPQPPSWRRGKKPSFYFKQISLILSMTLLNLKPPSIRPIILRCLKLRCDVVIFNIYTPLTIF